MKYRFLLMLGFCLCIIQLNAQQKSIYLDRAEEIFSLVWDKYRVPEHGLFSEYYPNSYKPDLNYFQGDVQQAKEVSYLWPMSGIFSSTTVLMEINPRKYAPYLDSMIVAVEQYLDKTRTPYGYQAYPSKFEVVDRYYDDNGLVGIDYIDSYNVTKNPIYLNKAKEVMTFIESGWSDDFGGGVSWLEGVRDQKPACSNGKATVLALKIYQASGEEKYLHYGMKSYNWMLSTLRDDSLNIIWNSLLIPEGTKSNVQKHAYTYNTGTMIQAAVRLYKITDNVKYLEDAKALAEGSYRYYFDYTDKGVPYVKDMPWFTLVLFRGYQELYEVDQNSKYVDAVIERADWAWEHARDGEGLPYHDWSGKEDESKKPKWLLDTSCMAELYARIAIIKSRKKTGMSQELSKKIGSDKRISQVEKMAKNLVKQGLTAGDSYREVWIRDLNTFVELGCHVGEAAKIKDALLIFFKFQGEDGNIPDGYIPVKEATVGYQFIYSKYEPRFAAHKNTVETDQESSLIQAIFKYIYATKDTSILDEKVGGRSVEERMGDAMRYLLNERYSEKYGLLWGATTSDWGDVQPEHEWGVELDDSSHLAIDIYDNAMFIIAMNNYTEIARNQEEIAFWKTESKKISENTRKHLWDNQKQKFIPHIYLDDSPFPVDFDENVIHYHGGTTMAIEAGLLNKDEIKTVYMQMLQNVKDANAQTIGLTLYPVYPNGYFKNIGMEEYSYQNGGDWTWFGGRMIQQLIENKMYDEAYESISPMLDRVLKHKDFYEWWTPSGEPKGAANFRGSAGVLWKSIQLFKQHMPENNQ